jgi:hypothetical protein
MSLHCACVLYLESISHGPAVLPRNQDFARPKELKQQKKEHHEPWEHEEELARGRGAALVEAAEYLGVVHA